MNEKLIAAVKLLAEHCNKMPLCHECLFSDDDGDCLFDISPCNWASKIENNYICKPEEKLSTKLGASNYDDFTCFMISRFDEMKALFEQKNKQYGNDDPLANFRSGAYLAANEDSWVAMFEEAKGYGRKHIAQVYGRGQNIDTPKVEESLKDIAVYSLIMLYMWKKNKEQDNER